MGRCDLFFLLINDLQYCLTRLYVQWFFKHILEDLGRSEFAWIFLDCYFWSKNNLGQVQIKVSWQVWIGHFIQLFCRFKNKNSINFRWFLLNNHGIYGSSWAKLSTNWYPCCIHFELKWDCSVVVGIGRQSRTQSSLRCQMQSKLKLTSTSGPSCSASSESSLRNTHTSWNGAIATRMFGDNENRTNER